MESQRISVAKAGINATLQCRCSMLAAANPKYGRFDEDAPIAEQIDLPPALMSRFDMIFVLTDKPNVTLDKNITDHILMAHQRGQARMYPAGANVDGINVDEIISRSDLIKPIYTIEMLRKYVAYSKRLTPIMTDEAKAIVQDSYLRIRKMGNGGNSVPITARQLEAFVRLSEASARMRLSTTVTDVDANRAVDLVEYYLKKIAGNDDGGFDIDKIASGVSSKDRNRLSIVRDIFAKYGDEGLTMDLLVKYGIEEGLDEAEVTRAVKSLSDGAEIIRTTTGEYRRV